VGILITRLVFHSDWSSGSRLSSVLLHWSFSHSLSWVVTDLCRRLNSAFKAGSLVVCHCLLTGSSGVFRPRYEPVMWAVGQQVGGTLSRICQRFRESDCQFLDTRVKSPLIREVRVGWQPSSQAGLEFGPVGPQIRAVRCYERIDAACR